MTGSTRLYLTRSHRCGHTIITAIGTIDRHTVPQLRSMLLAALARDGPYAVLDLSAVDHLDDVGVDALRRTARRAAALGGHFQLAAPHPAITTTIREAGLPWCMRITHTVPDALAHHRDDQHDHPDDTDPEPEPPTPDAPDPYVPASPDADTETATNAASADTTIDKPTLRSRGRNLDPLPPDGVTEGGEGDDDRPQQHR